MPLLNCELELDLPFSKECIISEISITTRVAANPPNSAREAIQTTGRTFQINNAKPYVPVITWTIFGTNIDLK